MAIISPDDEAWTIAALRSLCVSKGWRTDAVFAINIQLGRTSQGSSVVVDFVNNKILSVYPHPEAGAAGKYKETRISDYLVCYRDDMDVIDVDSRAPASSTSASTDTPFCCGNITVHAPRRLDKERYMTALTTGRGDFPDAVFEVKRQVDRGAMISTTHWTVTNDHCERVEGKFLRKMDVFKNYKCARHGLFFGVDVFYANNDGPGGRYHHQRLSLFTRIDEEFLREFFAEVGVKVE